MQPKEETSTQKKCKPSKRRKNSSKEISSKRKGKIDSALLEEEAVRIFFSFKDDIIYRDRSFTVDKIERVGEARTKRGKVLSKVHFKIHWSDFTIKEFNKGLVGLFVDVFMQEKDITKKTMPIFKEVMGHVTEYFLIDKEFNKHFTDKIKENDMFKRKAIGIDEIVFSIMNNDNKQSPFKYYPCIKMIIETTR